MNKRLLVSSAIVACLFAVAYRFLPGVPRTSTNNRWIPPEQTAVDKPMILWWYKNLFPFGESPADEQCGSVVCRITSDKSEQGDPNTRAVIFYGTDFKEDQTPLPRLPHHMWALLHEESPKNNYVLTQPEALELFNLTSTSSRYSDYPITLQYLPSLKYLFQRPPVPVAEKNARQKSLDLAPVAYVQTVCDNPSDRDRYIKQLMEHIKVDALGDCLHNRDLPDEFKPTTAMFDEGFYDVLASYKFILAFENGICNDYMTEKLWRPHHLGVVPVYRGSPLVRDWLPNSKSAILVDDFANPAELAQYLLDLDANDTAYEEHLSFKNPEMVTNKLLLQRLEERLYSTTVEQFLYEEEEKPSFVSGFACFVCKKIHERIALEEKHRKEGLAPPKPWTADKTHFDCPRPRPGIGNRQEILYNEPESSVALWNGVYISSRRDAKGLREMILQGETNSSRFPEYQEMIGWEHDPEEPEEEQSSFW